MPQKCQKANAPNTKTHTRIRTTITRLTGNTIASEEEGTGAGEGGSDDEGVTASSAGVGTGVDVRDGCGGAIGSTGVIGAGVLADGTMGTGVGMAAVGVTIKGAGVRNVMRPSSWEGVGEGAGGVGGA